MSTNEQKHASSSALETSFSSEEEARPRQSSWDLGGSSGGEFSSPEKQSPERGGSMGLDTSDISLEFSPEKHNPESDKLITVLGMSGFSDSALRRHKDLVGEINKGVQPIAKLLEGMQPKYEMTVEEVIKGGEKCIQYRNGPRVIPPSTLIALPVGVLKNPEKKEYFGKNDIGDIFISNAITAT